MLHILVRLHDWMRLPRWGGVGVARGERSRGWCRRWGGHGGVWLLVLHLLHLSHLQGRRGTVATECYHAIVRSLAKVTRLDLMVILSVTGGVHVERSVAGGKSP